MSRELGELVAVVDTNAASLGSTVRFLRGLGCRVLGFASADLALAQLTARPVDVVIDAHGASVAGGRSLGPALREALGDACPPIVLAHSGKIDRDDAAGYDAVVRSPLGTIELIAALERLAPSG